MTEASNGAPAALRVASVTVAYNPAAERLIAQLTTLVNQVERVIVVDNGSTPSARSLVPEPLAGAVHWCLNAGNLGIAAALNIGIRAAMAHECGLVLTLDHDSVPASDMAAQLVRALLAAEQQPGRVAAVGARIVDARNQREFPFIRLGWWRNQHLYCAATASLIDSDFLISSGCLARTETYQTQAVGALDESLFIDNVDMEWSYRARHRGYRLVGVCGARLDHRLGDEHRRVLFGVSLVVHSPLRLYYMTRNRIALYRRHYVPLAWKLKDVLRMLAKLGATLLFLAPRRAYLRMSLAAVADAWRGVSGPFVPRR